MCHARGVRVIAAARRRSARGRLRTEEQARRLLTRAEKVKTKTELERALGAPDERDKLGPLEVWTYDVSDGNVTFLITGDDVTLQATGQSPP